jgi:hypothetical protein
MIDLSTFDVRLTLQIVIYKPRSQYPYLISIHTLERFQDNCSIIIIQSAIVDLFDRYQTCF